MNGPRQTISPRSGETLQVAIVARISGCTNQTEVSLNDQVDHGKSEIAYHFTGPVNYHTFATKGKGESIDRHELSELEALLRSRVLDILFVEDLGRLVRGEEAVRLCGVAVDHGTRVISPNDCIDTAESTWQEDALAASSNHVSHNSQTSKD